MKNSTRNSIQKNSGINADQSLNRNSNTKVRAIELLFNLSGKRDGSLNSCKANVAVKILSILVIAVITSVLVLISVRTGIISVKAEYEPVEVLNVQFLPLQASGTIDIREFSFCASIDEQFNCFPQTSFNFGDQVHFKYVIESTVFDGQVMMVKNYRVKSPSGQLLLDADSKDNFYVDVRSQKKSEAITFKDYFTVLGVGETGEYTLELVIENPLIQKRATLVKKFEVLRLDAR